MGQTRTYIKQLTSILWDNTLLRDQQQIYKSVIESMMTYEAEKWVLNKEKIQDECY